MHNFLHAMSKNSPIFVKNGVPMEFVMRTCHARSKIQLLVEKNGGVFRWKGGINVFRIADPAGQFCYDDKDKVISAQFVYDCVEQNRLLNVDLYVIESKSEGFLLTSAGKCPMEISYAPKINQDVNDTIIIRYILTNQQNFVNLSRPDFLRRLEFDKRITFPNPKEFTCHIRRICKHINSYGLSPNHISTFINLCTFKNVLPFYKTDDMKILNYIVNNDSYAHVKDSDLWEDMEIEKITEHSAKSMCIRFHHTILPNLKKYHLSPGKLKKLEITANAKNSKVHSIEEKKLNLNISPKKIKQQLKIKLSVDAENASSPIMQVDSQTITEPKTKYLDTSLGNKRRFSDFEKFRNPKVSKNNKLIFVPRKLQRGVMAFKLYKLPNTSNSKQDSENMNEQSLKSHTEQKDLSIDKFRKVLDFKLCPEISNTARSKLRSCDDWQHSIDNIANIHESYRSETDSENNTTSQRKESLKTDETSQRLDSSSQETCTNCSQPELTSLNNENVSVKNQHKVLKHDLQLVPNTSSCTTAKDISSSLNLKLNTKASDINICTGQMPNNIYNHCDHSISSVNNTNLGKSLTKCNSKSDIKSEFDGILYEDGRAAINNSQSTHTQISKLDNSEIKTLHNSKSDTFQEIPGLKLKAHSKSMKSNKRCQLIRVQPLSIDGLRKTLESKLEPKISGKKVESTNLYSLQNTSIVLEKNVDSNVDNDPEIPKFSSSHDTDISSKGEFSVCLLKLPINEESNFKSQFQSSGDIQSIDSPFLIPGSSKTCGPISPTRFSISDLRKTLDFKLHSKTRTRKTTKIKTSDNKQISTINCKKESVAKNLETNSEKNVNPLMHNKTLKGERVCGYAIDTDISENCNMQRNIHDVQVCSHIVACDVQEDNIKSFPVSDLQNTSQFKPSPKINVKPCKGITHNATDDALPLVMKKARKLHEYALPEILDISNVQNRIAEDVELPCISCNIQTLPVNSNSIEGIISYPKTHSNQSIHKTLECKCNSNNVNRDKCNVITTPSVQNSPFDLQQSSVSNNENADCVDDMSTNCGNTGHGEDTINYLEPVLNTTVITKSDMANGHSELKPFINMKNISLDEPSPRSMKQNQAIQNNQTPLIGSLSSPSTHKYNQDSNSGNQTSGVAKLPREEFSKHVNSTTGSFSIEQKTKSLHRDLVPHQLTVSENITSHNVEDKIEFCSTLVTSAVCDNPNFSICGLRKSLETKLFQFDNIHKTLDKKLRTEGFPVQSPPVFYSSKLKTVIKPQTNNVSDICNVSVK